MELSWRGKYRIVIYPIKNDEKIGIFVENRKNTDIMKENGFSSSRFVSGSRMHDLAEYKKGRRKL